MSCGEWGETSYIGKYEHRGSEIEGNNMDTKHDVEHVTSFQTWTHVGVYI